MDKKTWLVRVSLKPVSVEASPMLGLAQSFRLQTVDLWVATQWLAWFWGGPEAWNQKQ